MRPNVPVLGPVEPLMKAPCRYSIISDGAPGEYTFMDAGTNVNDIGRHAYA